MDQPLTVRDLSELTSWHADWKGLRVAILGLGVTGFAAADTLLELGAEALVIAESASGQRKDMLEVIGGRLILDSHADVVPPGLEGFRPELVIVSPGYRPEHAILQWARASDVPVWGDIELAWRLRDKVGIPAEWLAVTGTNGKTTTVQLASHILVSSGVRAVPAGNIGIPVLDAIRDPHGFDVIVVELSSFQLHWMPREGVGSISPLASVCVNLADDHLDWHGSRESYATAKATVYANTRIACIYNRADEKTMQMVEEANVVEGCRAIGFGLDVPGPSDFGIVDGILVDRAFLDDRQRSALEFADRPRLAQAGIISPHMVSNLLAAAALTRAAGVEIAPLSAAIMTFRPDRHRLETVASAGGITWVDDSKATNPHAATAALSTFGSTVWIVGGLLKGVELDPIVKRHGPSLRGVVVLGHNRKPVVEAFQRHAPDVPLFEVVAADTDEVMREAVRLASAVARKGDTVLLAPAAASMDQFVDYQDRGDRFAAAVGDHVGGAQSDNEPSDTGEPSAAEPESD